MHASFLRQVAESNHRHPPEGNEAPWRSYHWGRQGAAGRYFPGVILHAPLEALQEWLNRPEHSELRRAFASWLSNVLLPMRMPGVEIPQVADLQEVKAMLADRVVEWTREWKREGFEEGFGRGTEEGLRNGVEKGVERARSEVREVLVRHLEARFGPLSEEARGRLEAIDSLEDLAEMMGRVPLVCSLDELGLG